MEQKLCRVCGKLMNIDNFNMNIRMKDGHRNECKECCKKLYNNKEKIRKKNLQKEIKKEGDKICRICNFKKPLIDFHLKRGTFDGRRSECKICCENIQKKYKEDPKFNEKQKEYHKKRYEEKKEEILEKKRQYHIENREEILKKKIEYRNKLENKEKSKNWRNNNKELLAELQSKYRRENPHCIAWRSVLYSTLKRLDTPKQDKTINLLGYSAIELKEHIEKQFQNGMTWDNYGEWQIDHIHPVISFDKETDVKIVCSLDNLRPLWATTREIDGVIYEGNLNRPKRA